MTHDRRAPDSANWQVTGVEPIYSVASAQRSIAHYLQGIDHVAVRLQIRRRDHNWRSYLLYGAGCASPRGWAFD